MWIDAHCHLDAHEFGAESLDVARRAAAAGVGMIVIPAVERGNFGVVAQLAADAPNASYALGIHPIYVPQARDEDLLALRAAVEAALADPRFVAIGEIGLDFFIPMLCEPAMREKQEHFFREQLRIAREFALPVLMHVRRSQDRAIATRPYASTLEATLRAVVARVAPREDGAPLHPLLAGRYAWVGATFHEHDLTTAIVNAAREAAALLLDADGRKTRPTSCRCRVKTDPQAPGGFE